MTKKFPHIIFIVFLSIFCLASLKVPAMCADEYANGVSGMTAQLLERINHARINPLETAAQYGVSPETLLAKLPEMADTLIEGLPALIPNSFLHTSATNHTLDMLTNDFYNKVGLDGQTFAERISDTGYLPDSSGEVLGVVAFKNFMAPETAVGILFENMFMKEISSDASTTGNLLNPNFVDIGIGISTGTMTIGNARYNVYLVTCDLAAPGTDPEKMTGQLVQLINQARAWPLDVAAILGYDVATVLGNMPESESFLFTGLSPLAVNEQLAAAAQVLTLDILAAGDSDNDPLDDAMVPEDPIATSGYDAYFADTVNFEYTAPKATTPDKITSAIFNMLFNAELEASDVKGKIILNRDFEDIGVGLVCGLKWADEQEMIACTGVVATGLMRHWENPKITGHVFSDRNNDGFYTPGEGLSGEQLQVSDYGVLLTGKAGQFQLQTEPGIYQIALEAADDRLLRREIDLDFVNKGVRFLP